MYLFIVCSSRLCLFSHCFVPFESIVWIQNRCSGVFNPNIVFMSMGVFLFFTDVVSKHKFSNKFKRVITSLSGLTYGIYLIHVLILKVLHNMGVSLSFCAKSVSILIVSLITFIFAAIIVYLMKKVPLVGKYLC